MALFHDFVRIRPVVCSPETVEKNEKSKFSAFDGSQCKVSNRLMASFFGASVNDFRAAKPNFYPKKRHLEIREAAKARKNQADNRGAACNRTIAVSVLQKIHFFVKRGKKPAFFADRKVALFG